MCLSFGSSTTIIILYFCHVQHTYQAIHHGISVGRTRLPRLILDLSISPVIAVYHLQSLIKEQCHAIKLIHKYFSSSIFAGRNTQIFGRTLDVKTWRVQPVESRVDKENNGRSWPKSKLENLKLIIPFSMA